jgi:hypothetical protein
MTAAPRSIRGAVAALVLLAIFFIELWIASGQKSPAWDEPGHIASGVANVQLGSLAVNPQHPPLLKALSGLSLSLAGAKWPDVPQARELLNGNSKWQWDIGSLILINAGVERALQWARFPLMLVALLGGLVIYLWGRQIAGELAGLAALALYILDPTIASHSYLVTFDVGLGAFTLLFLFTLWNYLRAPGRLLRVLCGITLGLALCTKFSAVALLPLSAALLLVGRWQDRSDSRPAANITAKHKNRRASKAAPQFEAGWIKSSAISLLWIYGIAAFVVLVCYRFHGLDVYLAGASQVNQDHTPGYLAYLAGDLAPGFTSYFAMTYLLKEPIAAIVLAVVGLVFLLRSNQFALQAKLFLLVPPAALFLLHMWKADDLGIRYIIPCLPFAHLLGGIAVSSLWSRRALVPRVVAVALCVWVAVVAAGIYPDGLSYFNESACLLSDPGKLGLDGGSRCGIAWLDDSNVDWGEGLKQLQSWMTRNARGRTALLAYFGSFPPAAYDSPVEQIDENSLWFQPKPGLYAVSAHLVAHQSVAAHRGRAPGDEWMVRTRPTAIVGHCLYIFDIPEPQPLTRPQK